MAAEPTETSNLTARWVPYGRGAAEALRETIAGAKGSEPLAPVTVVVPSNHVGVATRRLLASGRVGAVCGRGVGLAAVSFLTTYRLAELLGSAALAAEGRRPVSTPVIAAAVRSALASAPGMFEPVATHPATESALVASYRELRDLPPGALDQLTRSGRRGAEVVRLAQTVRAHLAPRWYDEQDLMAAAAAVLDAGPSDAPVELGVVVVHLPQLISLHSARLLRAVSRRTSVVVLAGASGAPRADEEVRRSLDRLEVAVGSAPAVGQLGPTIAPSTTTITTASDSDDEVRAAVRSVMSAVRAGLTLDAIAVLHPGTGPYPRMVHEQLAAAGVATNGPAVLPVANRTAGRALLRLLELPEGGWRRTEVFAWLSSAPLLHDGTAVPVTRWEAISREAGVVGGRADWDRRLQRLVDDRTARAAALAAEGADQSRVERKQHEAAQAAALRSFVLGLVDRLADAAGADVAWDARAAWTRQLLQDLLGGPSHRQSWDAPEARAAERIDLALDRLAALAEVEGPVELAVFNRTLQLELEGDLGRVGRFGEGVFVGPIGMAVGLDLEHVVIVGLAEGSFPATVQDDSLLPDRERDLLGGLLPLRSGRVDRSHRELLAAIASSQRQLLCVPRGDLRRSVERVPCRWLLDVAGQLAATGERLWSPDLLRVPTEPHGWLRHIRSFDDGLRQLDEPATEQEHRLRRLLASATGRAGLLADDDAVIAAGALVVASRRSAQFTRFDGDVSSVSLRSPVEEIMSPTGLERWARCPQAYFQQRVLGVREVEHPEDSLRITAMDWGSLVHSALEGFLDQVLAEGPPPPDQAWTLLDRRRIIDIAEGLFAEYEQQGLTGRAIFWRRDRADIERDLLQFLEADSLHRAHTTTRPIAAELRFGPDVDPVGAVAMPLPDGRALAFRGSADRVDRSEDGTLHVVDYKTGRSAPYSKLSAEDPTQAGTRLQLPVYGQAARAQAGTAEARVVAQYWFIGAKGGFARAGYEITDDVLAEVSRVLGWIVAGIEAGLFPHHPTALSTSPWVECPYCDPDGLGVTDLRRQWDRKRTDPRVAGYADVVEPPGDREIAPVGPGVDHG